MVMVNALLVNPLATKAKGSIEGVRIVAAADQPFALAGSFQIEKLTREEVPRPPCRRNVTLSCGGRDELADGVRAARHHGRIGKVPPLEA